MATGRRRCRPTRRRSDAAPVARDGHRSRVDSALGPISYAPISPETVEAPVGPRDQPARGGRVIAADAAPGSGERDREPLEQVVRVLHAGLHPGGDRAATAIRGASSRPRPDYSSERASSRAASGRYTWSMASRPGSRGPSSRGQRGEPPAMACCWPRCARSRPLQLDRVCGDRPRRPRFPWRLRPTDGAWAAPPA